MKRCLIALALFLSSLAQNFSLAQTTITVGQGVGYDYATIQAAIDAATTGDTIIVYPGIYYENIHFRGFDITLRSTEPSSKQTRTAEHGLLGLCRSVIPSHETCKVEPATGN